MRILVINAGSSSLKWSVVQLPGGDLAASGSEPLPAGAAPDLSRVTPQVGAIDAIAHRIVDAGLELRTATRVDAGLLDQLGALIARDPLHLPRALSALTATQAAWPRTPQVVCFDTDYHQSIPETAARYPLPFDWAQRFGAWRLGFHGLSVAHAVGRAPELAGAPLRRLVVCHLGSGCSLTAVEAGASRDTTMGFTPLEGVMMSTRSGTIDPGLLLHLLRERKLSVDELDHALEAESGLLGVSGLSADFRAVLQAADRGHARAALAYAMFVHSVRRGLGQVLMALDGLDGLVFTGGIGEHSSRLRAEVVAPLAWLGAKLDAAKNEAAQGDADVTGSGAGVRILVVTAREDLVMAREAEALLAAQ
jgi:acetate kinase